MTADASTQKKMTTAGAILPTVSLVFAAVTLLFALLSVIVGNRMAAVSRTRVEAQINAEEMEKSAIEKAAAALEETRKQAEAEKAGNAKLRKQLSAAMQEVKKLKTDLAKAHQTIDTINRKAAITPAPDPVSPPANAGATTDAKAPAQQKGPDARMNLHPTGESPGVIQKKTASEMPEQAESRTTDSAQQDQRPRLEESTIQPDSSDAGGLTGTMAQKPETARSTETAPGPILPKPSGTTDSEASE